MSDPEIDKILNKAFEDIKKRLNSVIVKREKKLAKEFKTAKPDTTNKKKDDRSNRRPRKEYDSYSSTESSESR